MRASKGGLTHDIIMRLTWRQFETYLDSFTYLVRQESEKGQQENQRDDVAFLKEDQEYVSEVESEKERGRRIAAKYKHLGETGIKGSKRSLL